MNKSQMLKKTEKFKISSILDFKYLSVTVTILLFLVTFMIGSLSYEGFFSTQVFLNLFIDNAHLIVMAVGMTFVLLIGGIDISVGSVLALTCMLSAYLLETKNLNPVIVIPLVLFVGLCFGLGQGFFIHFFDMQPFIVTLAGLFLARGLTYVISEETINIENEFYVNFSNEKIPIFDGYISYNVVIALVVFVVGMFIAHYTKFGRSIYAVGGNEQSAKLMGLKVGKTKVIVYGISGFCAALAGVIFSFYMKSGYTLHGVGMELDAIASVVIGGTLLTGGVGYLLGSIFGVLIQGVIISIINFQGTLSAWWTKIVVALLLLLFIMLQKILTLKKKK
jgi:simple sugar transport system permease protein